MEYSNGRFFCTFSFLRICSSWRHDFTTRCFVINSIFTHECALLWKFSKNFNFIKLCFHTSINTQYTHGKRTELRMKKKVSHGHNFYLRTMGWNPFCPDIFLNLYIFMKHVILLQHKNYFINFLCAKNIIFPYKLFHPIVSRKVLKNVMVGQYKFFYNTSQSFFPFISTSNNLEKVPSFCSTVLQLSKEGWTKVFPDLS